MLLLLPVQMEEKMKRIVFTSMPNRSESHLPHCINPESGSRWCHSAFFRVCVCELMFISYQHFNSTFFSPFVYHLFFPLLLFLFHAVCTTTNYATIFIADHYEQLFFYPLLSLWPWAMSIHKLIWYVMENERENAYRWNENLIKIYNMIP